jgi:hypothetical protein
MTGSPLFRAILTAIAFGLLIFPLRALTNHHPGHTVPATVASVPTRKKVHLEITCTAAPFRFQILNEGRLIWDGESKSGTTSTDTELDIPEEGVDLVLDASWSERKETAIRLSFSQDKSETISRTVWGTTNVSEVLTFVPER